MSRTNVCCYSNVLCTQWSAENKNIAVFCTYITYTCVPGSDNNLLSLFVFLGGRQQLSPPHWVRATSLTTFLDDTQRSTTVGRTPLDEWSARCRDLYLTTHNTHKGETFMPPGEIRTHDLSRRAAADLRLRPRGHCDGICSVRSYKFVKFCVCFNPYRTNVENRVSS